MEGEEGESIGCLCVSWCKFSCAGYSLKDTFHLINFRLSFCGVRILISRGSALYSFMSLISADFDEFFWGLAMKTCDPILLFIMREFKSWVTFFSYINLHMNLVLLIRIFWAGSLT